MRIPVAPKSTTTLAHRFSSCMYRTSWKKYRIYFIPTLGIRSAAGYINRQKYILYKQKISPLFSRVFQTDFFSLRSHTTFSASSPPHPAHYSLISNLPLVPTLTCLQPPPMPSRCALEQLHFHPKFIESRSSMSMSVNKHLHNAPQSQLNIVVICQRQ